MSDIEYFNIKIHSADWQQHQQQLSEIRYQVFVNEQKVPIEIEIDEQDPIAQHWLAYDPAGQHIGTARLEESGKIGRMAVLDEFRGRGVGAALLRRIILDASSQGMVELYLHAQTHAIRFYSKFGFIESGEQFDEGGIPHITMRLDLGRYRYRAVTSEVVSSHLPNKSELTNAFEQLAIESRQKIRIYSEKLHSDLLKDLAAMEAMRQFFSRSSESQLLVLVRDIDSDTSTLQPLLALQRRLDTRFGIRQCEEREQVPNSDLLILFDEEQLIQSLNNAEGEAQLLKHARAEVRQHTQLFDDLWQRSTVPVEVRQLNISG